MGNIIRQIWMCESYIPETSIRYRPHVLLISFFLLVPIALYPTTRAFSECDELMTYLYRHCPGPSPFKCLQPYADEIDQCCNIDTFMDNEPSRGYSLVIKNERCYYDVYKPAFYTHTIIMMFVVFFGVWFTFMYNLKEKPKEAEEV